MVKYSQGRIDSSLELSFAGENKYAKEIAVGMWFNIYLILVPCTGCFEIRVG